MKRSPIQRSAPLRRSVRPVAGTKARSDTRQRDTGPDAATRALVARRCGECCEVCGVSLRDMVASLHHRLPRRMGGTVNPAVNSAANLLYVCGSGTTGCHGLIESQRATSYLMGLLLRDGQDPCSEPFQSVIGWHYLTPDGSKVPA